MITSAFYLLIALPVCVLGHRVLRTARARQLWIAAWSIALLIQYAGLYAIPLVGCVAWGYAVSGIAARAAAHRRLWTLAAVAPALGYVLAVKWPGGPFDPPPGALWITPLAASYVTFQIVHFAVERARGNLGAPADALTFTAYSFFFPTLPAGPIKRYANFATQAAAHADGAAISEGVFRIAVGFFKKLVLAQSFHLWLDGWKGADQSMLAAWGCVYLYFLYIYCDFSGYSDIAIGAARLFGIRIEENFKWPILASNPSAFWKRWHMSLTGIARDYVFIPLGGSRVGAPGTARNTILTMALIGLWHALSWNMLAWGLYHAALLLAYRAWRRVVPAASLGRWATAAGVVATFHLVGIGWVLFDMPLARALPILMTLVGG